MKVILSTLNSKYIHTNTALRYLKANAENFDITIREYTIKDDLENVANNLLAETPSIIGLSCYIWNIEKTIKLVQLLKQKNPSVIIFVGGPEVSYDYDVWFNRMPIDYLLYGEGELAFKELMQALHGEIELSAARGVVYKNLMTQELVVAPKAPILPPSQIKSPHRFEEDIPHLPNRIQYIETSRGCPYQCQYCLASVDNNVRYFDKEQIKDDIRYLMNHGGRVFKFLDRTFNINKTYALEMFDFIIKEHLPGTQFQFEITADIMPTELIDYLNEHAPAGLFRFEIGIQSTYDLTNQLVKRRQNFTKLATNITRIQEGGKIVLHLDLIAGLPEESYERFEQSFNEVFAFRASELQLGFLKLLRGTGLRQQADEFGYEFEEHAPYEMIRNNVLSQEDANNIHLAEEILERYWNAHRMDLTMTYLFDHAFAASPFKFMQQFGVFFDARYEWIRYQLPDLFTRLVEFLESIQFDDMQTVQSYMKIDYLTNSKIKPKIWWHDRLSKKERNDAIHALLEEDNALTDLVQELNLHTNDLFKYGVLEQVYVDAALQPTNELHYLFVLYMPGTKPVYRVINLLKS